MKTCLLLLAVLSLSGCQPEAGPAGPPGPTGPRGEQGVPGPQGPDGASGIGLASGVHCDSAETLINGRSISFFYDEYVFADGSVMASCDLFDRYTSFSGEALFKPGTNGANGGWCLVSYEMDAGAGTGGFWTLEHPTGASTNVSARYNDTGSPYNGRSISLTCTRF